MTRQIGQVSWSGVAQQAAALVVVRQGLAEPSLETQPSVRRMGVNILQRSGA